MNNKLFMIIQTNSYVGNFESELMAYVFGYNRDYNGFEETVIFEKEMGIDNREMFLNYFDTMAFGEHDEEYSCYKIDSHPTNKEYKCDSIYICLDKKLPKELSKIASGRLKSFCDYYNKKYNKDIEIVDVNYYQNKFTKVDEETL